MTYKYTVYADQSGHIQTNLGNFPIYARECNSSMADEDVQSYINEYHWHNDLEFIYMESGGRDMIVSGTRIHLNQRQGLFINSARMHRVAVDESDSTYITVRIDPQVFTKNYDLGAAYFDRKFGSTNVDYIILDESVDWQNDVIERIITLFKKQEMADSRPLSSISTALSLIEVMGNHIPDSTRTAVNRNDYDSFTAMTQYIREHIGDKIQIEDIAHAGHVSRAKVYTLFYNFSSHSPNTYLMLYRVDKSANMLRNTNLSIADIAAMCGFRTPSYFASVFRKEKGVTPREYRAKYQ